ncbi:MAG: GNAT family N-acetyltransferase [Cyanobacteria bacterium HKST-UBA02]|nr:GNAT family N-acetyltransferase [Cyanobacteria bacterium HKST-UBA02]
MKTQTYQENLPEEALEQIVDIYLACFTGPPRFETWTRQEVRNHLLAFKKGGADFLVVTDSEEDGKIASFAIGIPMVDYFGKEEILAYGIPEDSYYFAELGTRPECRGRGYGATLHRSREARAVERGFTRLSVRVRKDNDVNIKLLERAGFAAVADYRGEIAGSVAEKFLLVKEIIK